MSYPLELYPSSPEKRPSTVLLIQFEAHFYALFPDSRPFFYKPSLQLCSTLLGNTREWPQHLIHDKNLSPFSTSTVCYSTINTSAHVLTGSLAWIS